MTAASLSRVIRPFQASHLARTWANRRDVVLRSLDVILASLALVVVAPIMAVIALLIVLTSPGTAIFRQTRVGYRQQNFPMLKFRTMRDHCDESVHQEFVRRMLAGDDPRSQPGSGLYKLQADPRVTAAGAFLRRTSMDELPQLINVLRGEMSLVGPRPMLPWEVELCDQRYLKRFDIKPGISGLWQVKGRNRLSMQDGLKLDLEYLARRSVRLYVEILLRTIPAVLFDRDCR
jgi:lipopolysaccharide/colanic/teichoic acid biosynthesis glycosyltransferase